MNENVKSTITVITAFGHKKLMVRMMQAIQSMQNVVSFDFQLSECNYFGFIHYTAKVVIFQQSQLVTSQQAPKM